MAEAGTDEDAAVRPSRRGEDGRGLPEEARATGRTGRYRKTDAMRVACAARPISLDLSALFADARVCTRGSRPCPFVPAYTGSARGRQGVCDFPLL